MRTSRAIWAFLLAGLLVGCMDQDPASRQARHDRKIPVTPPKEVATRPVAITQAASAGAAAQPGSPAASGPATPLPVASLPVKRPAAVTSTASHPTIPSTVPQEPTPPPKTASLPAKTQEPMRVLGRAETIEGPLVQANSRFIAVEDLLRSACFELDDIPKSLPEPAFRARAEKVLGNELQRMMTQALVLPEADKFLTDEQKKAIDGEIDETLHDMIARSDGSRKKLEESLSVVGTNVQAVLDAQRNKLTVQMFLRMKFAPSVHVNRQMMWDYYCANRGQFHSPPKVAMQIVAVPLAGFLPVTESQPSAGEIKLARLQARRRIEQAQEVIKKGEDFATVADRFSGGKGNPPGGIWPLMPAGSFRQEAVESQAFKLPESGISNIIETDAGYYVVKARQVQPGVVTPFEDAQAEIERTLREKQSAKLYDEYYQHLLKGATVAQPQNFLSLVVDQAVERFWRKGGSAATQHDQIKPAP